MLLGCTSLTTEHWTGSLWYYSDPSKAPSVKECLTGVDLENGLSQAEFLNDPEGKRMVAALDNGSLEFYTLSFSLEEVLYLLKYLKTLDLYTFSNNSHIVCKTFYY